MNVNVIVVPLILPSRLSLIRAARWGNRALPPPCLDFIRYLGRWAQSHARQSATYCAQFSIFGLIGRNPRTSQRARLKTVVADLRLDPISRAREVLLDDELGGGGERFQHLSDESRQIVWLAAGCGEGP